MDSGVPCGHKAFWGGLWAPKQVHTQPAEAGLSSSQAVAAVYMQDSVQRKQILETVYWVIICTVLAPTGLDWTNDCY